MHNKKGMISSFFALAEEQQHLYLPYVPNSFEKSIMAGLQTTPELKAHRQDVRAKRLERYAAEIRHIAMQL